MNSEGTTEGEAVSTGTVTSVFMRWEELMQYMLRVISNRSEK